MAVGPVQILLGLYVAIQRMTVSFGRVMELRGEEPTVVGPTIPKPIGFFAVVADEVGRWQSEHKTPERGVLGN